MPPVPEPSVLVIETGRAERHYWRDLWNYRGLFGFLGSAIGRVFGGFGPSIGLGLAGGGLRACAE